MAANVEAHLHVVGVQTHPSGQRVYRLATRDGHYVGRTNPTRVRALKGDVVKVTAAHIKMAESGDLGWMNAEVSAMRTGSRADSHRQLLERLEGGTDTTPDMRLIDKDNATDVPPAGDTGNVTTDQVKNVPTGPTASASHVDRPLKNISVFYGKKQKRLQVVKALEHQQLIYGVVLEPDVIDSQGDFVPAREVEKAAHRYLTKALRGQSSVSKLQHRVRSFSRTQPSVVPIESFIAPVDFTYQGSRELIKKGSWVLGVKVEDPDVWQAVLDGVFGGFSIGGTGKRDRMGGHFIPPPLPV